MNTSILKSTLKGLFLNIIIKSQQEHLYVQKKAIFLHNLVCQEKFSRHIYQNKHLTIMTFHQTSLIWSCLKTPGVIIFRHNFYTLQSLIHRIQD